MISETSIIHANCGDDICGGVDENSGNSGYFMVMVLFSLLSSF
jgi:hypothetical protein